MSCLIMKSKLRLTVGRKSALLLHIYFWSIVSFQIHFFLEARTEKVRTCITTKDTVYKEKSVRENYLNQTVNF